MRKRQQQKRYGTNHVHIPAAEQRRYRRRRHLGRNGQSSKLEEEEGRRGGTGREDGGKVLVVLSLLDLEFGKVYVIANLRTLSVSRFNTHCR